MYTIPPRIAALEKEILAEFPDATVGGDVDFPGGEFLIEVTRHAQDRQREIAFWLVCESPRSPLRYGIARIDENTLGWSTSCDRYFATFEEAREQFWELLRSP